MVCGLQELRGLQRRADKSAFNSSFGLGVDTPQKELINLFCLNSNINKKDLQLLLTERWEVLDFYRIDPEVISFIYY